jgi:hypothetical protein
LVWIETNHRERPVSGVHKELHEPLILARAIVSIVSVFVGFHYNDIRSHVHKYVGAAPRAPVGNALVKRDDVVRVSGTDKVSDGTLLGFVVADDLVVRVGVDVAPVAVAEVCFVGR